jgi:hypothetical protein
MRIGQQIISGGPASYEQHQRPPHEVTDPGGGHTFERRTQRVDRTP